MKKIFRIVLMIAFVCGAAMAPSSVFAYGACTDTYAGGCHVGTHCDYYDDETDEWTGSVTVEYQC